MFSSICGTKSFHSSKVRGSLDLRRPMAWAPRSCGEPQESIGKSRNVEKEDEAKGPMYMDYVGKYVIYKT